MPERMYCHVDSLVGYQVTGAERLRYTLMQKLDEKGERKRAT